MTAADHGVPDHLAEMRWHEVLDRPADGISDHIAEIPVALFHTLID